MAMVALIKRSFQRGSPRQVNPPIREAVTRPHYRGGIPGTGSDFALPGSEVIFATWQI